MLVACWQTHTHTHAISDSIKKEFIDGKKNESSKKNETEYGQCEAFVVHLLYIFHWIFFDWRDTCVSMKMPNEFKILFTYGHLNKINWQIHFIILNWSAHEHKKIDCNGLNHGAKGDNKMPKNERAKGTSIFSSFFQESIYKFVWVPCEKSLIWADSFDFATRTPIQNLVFGFGSYFVSLMCASHVMRRVTYHKRAHMQPNQQQIATATAFLVCLFSLFFVKRKTTLASMCVGKT